MPATFSCGECGFQTKVKDELSGKKIKCPKCQAVGVVGTLQQTGPAKKKDPPSADGMSTIAGLNLDSYKDVEVTEDDPDFADPKAETRPKPKKKRKQSALEGVSQNVKIATLVFVVLSLAIIAGLVFFVGQNVVDMLP